MDIIDELNAARRGRDVSDREIGEAVGLSRDAIAKIRGRQRGITYAEGLRIRSWIDQGSTRCAVRLVPIVGIIAAGEWSDGQEGELGELHTAAGGPNTFGLYVAGDSMDRYVDDGGAIAVDPDDKGLADGRVYAVRRSDGHTTIKRFQLDPARLEPMSSNPTHKTLVLGQSGYEVIGRVVWRQGPV